MSKRYRVRAAERADVHLLPAIERAATARFRDVGLAEVFLQLCMTAEQFEERQHAGRLWVAADARGKLIGFVTCSIIDSLAHLDEIDVLPRYGRRGVGSGLVKEVCRWAANRALPAVTLSTTRNVPWNIPFFERLGFRELEDTAFTDGLRRLRDAEAGAGLPLSRRVVMRIDLQRRALAPLRPF